MKAQNKVMLMILDGWGLGSDLKSDAIRQANTPYIDSLMKKYPNSQLLACGENVGLPEGQMGNSEVGHLNIGAGRVVYQDLVRINKAIEDNSIAENEKLNEAFSFAKENKRKLHFIGLVSDGGVHSMDSHLYKLCNLTDEFGLENVFIHAITDGRDTDPKSGKGYVKNLLAHLEHSNVKIASLIGRYYSMDRDKRWERVREGYDLMVHAKGKHSKDLLQSIQESYDEGVTDEFIKPLLCVDENDKALAQIENGDVVVCFNFRTDRLREMTIVLSQEDMPDHQMKTLDLKYYTMTRYDDSFKNVSIIYDKDNVKNTLGEVVANNKLNQIRIAETEKYAHVTFFFSGGREEEYPNEKRILVPSPKVATYDLQPEMSAYLVKDEIVAELKKQEVDFVCLNFANGDMVGHTGIWDAIIQAVEAVDSCVTEVVDTAKENGYEVIIIADHGNADFAVNADGSPNTAHSLNPVPFIVVSDRVKQVKNGILADVAPSILHLMGLEKPEEMTGSSLV